MWFAEIFTKKHELKELFTQKGNFFSVDCSKSHSQTFQIEFLIALSLVLLVVSSLLETFPKIYLFSPGQGGEVLKKWYMFHFILHFLAGFECIRYEYRSQFTDNLNMLSSPPNKESETQEFPDCRRSWKKRRGVSKASDVADEQMVNWTGKISKYQAAPDLEEQLFCQQPVGRSQQHFPQLHIQEVQAR